MCGKIVWLGNTICTFFGTMIMHKYNTYHFCLRRTIGNHHRAFPLLGVRVHLDFCQSPPVSVDGTSDTCLFGAPLLSRRENRKHDRTECVPGIRPVPNTPGSRSIRLSFLHRVYRLKLILKNHRVNKNGIRHI